jgi:hypothetical protein
MDDILIPIQTNLGDAPLDIGSYFSNIVGAALLIGAMASFAYLVIGGLQWATASNDKGRIELARNRITNAIIGLAIVALSWGIFLLLDQFFGLNVAGGSGSSGNRSTGLCSTSSARQCQGANPGDSCHDGNSTCYALNNQNPGDDGRVRCDCR